MASPAPKPYRNKWADMLPRGNYRYNEKDVINPDRAAEDAYITLYEYLDERRKLIEKKEGKAARRGRQETVWDYNKGAFRDNMSRLDTLLREHMQGSWPVYPADPKLEHRMFNQNQLYKKPLTSIY